MNYAVDPNRLPSPFCAITHPKQYLGSEAALWLTNIYARL